MAKDILHNHAHPHHEEEHDFGGRILDLIVLLGAMALFIGAVVSIVALAV